MQLRWSLAITLQGHEITLLLDFGGLEPVYKLLLYCLRGKHHWILRFCMEENSVRKGRWVDIRKNIRGKCIFVAYATNSYKWQWKYLRKDGSQAEVIHREFASGERCSRIIYRLITWFAQRDSCQAAKDSHTVNLLWLNTCICLT